MEECARFEIPASGLASNARFVPTKSFPCAARCDRCERAKRTRSISGPADRATNRARGDALHGRNALRALKNVELDVDECYTSQKSYAANDEIGGRPDG